jgi:chromosome transmission fidelity protein 1
MPAILEAGLKSSKMNFTYQNRNNKDVIVDLGLTIADICSHVKGGILVFFSSYSLMKEYSEIWAANGVRR